MWGVGHGKSNKKLILIIIICILVISGTVNRMWGGTRINGEHLDKIE